MKSKPVTPIEADINRRFFEAIEQLRERGSINSLQSFCNEAGLTPARYRELRFTYGVSPRTDKVSRYKDVEPQGLYFLVKKYHVSADWLLTGKGQALR
jgi:hypothetical protein